MSLLVSRVQGNGVKRRMSAPEYYSTRAKRSRHASVESTQRAMSPAVASDLRTIMLPESKNAVPVLESVDSEKAAVEHAEPVALVPLPTHGQRPKPHLSVNIPSPASFIICSDSMEVGSGTCPSTPLRTPSLPSTPVDQLIRRPSNPPPLPRYTRAKPKLLGDDQGDETPTETEIMIAAAHKRRVERLWAPTPTEWSFSSTLNHLPTPTQTTLISASPSASDSPREDPYMDMDSDPQEGTSNVMTPVASNTNTNTNTKHSTEIDAAPLLSPYILPRRASRRSSVSRPTSPPSYFPTSGLVTRSGIVRRRSTLGGPSVISSRDSKGYFDSVPKPVLHPKSPTS